MSAQVPPAAAAAAAAAGRLHPVPQYRSCDRHCRRSIRLIKAIRSPAPPQSGNYAGDRPTEYRIVSSNFSAPRSTIHQHACAGPDSARSRRRTRRRMDRGMERRRGGCIAPVPLAVLVITSLSPPIPSNSALAALARPPSEAAAPSTFGDTLCNAIYKMGERFFSDLSPVCKVSN